MFLKKKMDCIKILNNSDIVNYRTCQVVFYPSHTNRDTKSGENVHLACSHADAHDPRAHTHAHNKTDLEVAAIKNRMWNDSMAVVADSSLITE